MPDLTSGTPPESKELRRRDRTHGVPEHVDRIKAQEVDQGNDIASHRGIGVGSLIAGLVGGTEPPHVWDNCACPGRQQHGDQPWSSLTQRSGQRRCDSEFGMAELTRPLEGGETAAEVSKVAQAVEAIAVKQHDSRS